LLRLAAYGELEPDATIRKFRTVALEGTREVERLLDLNSVRAGMVQEQSEYSWSSYQCKGLGKHSDLLTAHPVYLSINEDINRRQADYRQLFAHHVEPKMIEDIRKATIRG